VDSATLVMTVVADTVVAGAVVADATGTVGVFAT